MPVVLAHLFQLQSDEKEHDQSTAHGLVIYVIPDYDGRIDVTTGAVNRAR